MVSTTAFRTFLLFLLTLLLLLPPNALAADPPTATRTPTPQGRLPSGVPTPTPTAEPECAPTPTPTPTARRGGTNGRSGAGAAATAAEEPCEPVADSEPSAPAAQPILIRVPPVALIIPSLNVWADVHPVEEDPDGAMTAPTDPDTVAWWSLGYGTGMPGNVVLAGHVDWGGSLRVFGQIHTLTPGDKIVVVDKLLREYHYEVEWSRWVKADGAAVEEIFSASDRWELTLITCGGIFDRINRQYVDRLIVRAVKV